MLNDSTALNELKTARLKSTNEVAFTKLESALFEVLPSNHTDCLIGRDTGRYFGSQGFHPDSITLSAFDLLGIRMQVYSQLKFHNSPFFVTYKGEEIEFKPFIHNFEYRKVDTPIMVQDLASARAAVPIYQAISELSSSSRNKESSAMSNTIFEIDQHPLQFLDVFEKLGIKLTNFEDMIKISQMYDHKDITNYINEVVIPRAKSEDIWFETMEENKNGELLNTISLKSNIHSAVKFKLLPQMGKGFKIGYELAVNMPYFEQPSYETSSIALPFIETRTAQQLLQAFANNGIIFSDSILEEVTTTIENDGYGCILTKISREVAKFINDRGRTNFKPLFKEDNEIVQKIKTINLSDVTDKTARALIVMLQESMFRNENPAPIESDLDITQSFVSMKDGSCFDVVGYYEEGKKKGRLRLEKYNQTQLIHKYHYGVDSYMTTEEIIFNSVHVPPGAIMLKGFDGNFALVRITPYIDIENALYGGFAPEVRKAFNRCNITKLTPIHDLTHQ